MKEKISAWISNTVKTKSIIEPVVRKGNAAHEIITQAGKVHDDLIVLGALHHPFHGSTFFGKTTDLVLRHAPVPVLMIPLFET